MSDDTRELLRKQLVGREDTGYHYTRYEFSPMRLPLSEIVLEEEPLGPSDLARHSLRTTPLLSLFGLYRHPPSGTTVVRCVGKTSFAVDETDEYELHDVVVRSGRSGWGVGDDRPAPPGGWCGRDLLEEIDRNTAHLFGPATPTQTPTPSLVPLLPVFLGYTVGPDRDDYDADYDADRDVAVAVVDMSSASGYKSRLRRLAAARDVRFVLFQERVSPARMTRTRVAVPRCRGHSVDAAVRHALAYRIVRRVFTRRLARYLATAKRSQQQQEASTADDVDARHAHAHAHAYRLSRSATAKRRSLNRVLLARRPAPAPAAAPDQPPLT